MNSVYKQSAIEKYNIDFEVPRHVAIIMDGNGRWAKRRGKPRVYGHKAGMERLHEIVKTASDIGIEALTLYAFSTENWSRPKVEVDALMSLLEEYFTRYIDELHENRVIIKHLGEPSGFSPKICSLIANACKRTSENDGMILNLALNYGSRQEILKAVKGIARDVKEGALALESIDDALFLKRLYTADSPELDLLIRTSGEERISNFLLYQAAYAELVFCDECWPDFTDDIFIRALREYSRRDRRFGKVK